MSAITSFSSSCMAAWALDRRPGRRRLLVWPLALSLSWLASPAFAAARPPAVFTSYFAGATVFRDGNGNARLDGREPSVTTAADGSFTPPKGGGRLYLQGGADIQTGKPNTLLLSAPPKAAAIGTITSLWQALLDRKQKQARIDALLGVPAGASLIDFAAVPQAKAAPKQAALLPADAKNDTLAKFLRAIADSGFYGGSVMPRAARAARKPAVLNDPSVQALADAMLKQKTATLDLTDPALVNLLIGDGAALLKLNLGAQERMDTAQAAAAINRQIDQNGGQLETLRKIADNASTTVQIADFSALTTQYTGDGLDRQIQGTLYIPSAKFERVSVAFDGGETDGASRYPVSSADGRYVAFQSDAGNLTPNDANGQADVFLRDLRGGTTVLVSRAADGKPGNKASGGGVVGSGVRISGDGRYVAYASEATDLSATFDLSGGCLGEVCVYLYVYDRQTGQNELQSLTPGSGRPMAIQYLAMNADGTALVFNGYALDGQLGGTFVRDIARRTTTQIPVPDPCVYPDISRDGRFVLCGSYYASDLFVYDRQTGRGASALPESESFLQVLGSDANNRYLLYCTTSPLIVPGAGGGLFLLDSADRSNTQIDDSQSILGSCTAHISPDGRYVAFSPLRPLTVDGVEYDGYGLFLRDGKTGKISPLSAGSVDRRVKVGLGLGYLPYFGDNGLTLVFATDKDVYLATGWWTLSNANGTANASLLSVDRRNDSRPPFAVLGKTR